MNIKKADWATTPAVDPPPGETSNLVDPPSIGYRVTVSNSVCALFVVVIVALRMYTRMHIVRGLGSDDLALLLSVVLWVCLIIVLEMTRKYGLGTHIWNVSLAQLSPNFLLLRVLAAVFYTTSMFFIKLSLLLLYRRIFDIRRFFKRWWAVMIYTCAHTTTSILLSFFACLPPRSQWDLRETANRKCISTAAQIAIPVFHCLNDLLILSLPIPVVWKLNLSFKRKVHVMIVFALGSASCIVSIIRLWPIIGLVRQGRSGDVTYWWTPVAIWTQAELSFCIVCACAPVLRPLLLRHFPALFSSDIRTSLSDPNNANAIIDGSVKTIGHVSRSFAPYLTPSRWLDDVDIALGNAIDHGDKPTVLAATVASASAPISPGRSSSRIEDVDERRDRDRDREGDVDNTDCTIKDVGEGRGAMGP